MVHQFPPHAPPPPPAMHHGMFPGMDQLGQDFRDTHIETIEPRFDNGSFNDIGGRGPMPRRTSDSNAKTLISYEGFTFAKARAEHAGQKETWAIARKTTMPVSQSDLKDQVQKQYKKGVTGLKQYEAQEMQGFKRGQIDRLIEDRERRDDHNFQYHIVSIKLEQRRLRSGKSETGTMRVILKRQLRQNVPFHPAMPPVGPPILSTETIDITGQGDPEIDSLGSSPKLHHGHFPLPRQHSEPWGHAPHVVPDVFMAQFGAPRGEEQGHGHGPHFPEAPMHGDHGGKEKKDDKGNKHGKEEKSDKKDKHDKKDKGDKKEKRPELHQSHSHKSDKKHHSDTSSVGSGGWDHMSDRTVDTFETFPSSSGAGKTYKKVKKHDKADHHKSHSHHGSRDRAQESQQPIYREHTRKVPEKARAYSPAPQRRSHRAEPRYSDEEVFVQPEVSHRGGRERQQESHRRQAYYSRERPSRRQPQRGMSYDDDPFDFEYDDQPSASYAKKVTRVPQAPREDYEKERLKLELERERTAKEHEMRERDRLDRELEKTTAELRRRQMPVRERMPPRDRRQSVVIDRDYPPMQRPRRAQEQVYDDYDDYDYAGYR